MGKLQRTLGGELVEMGPLFKKGDIITIENNAKKYVCFLKEGNYVAFVEYIKKPFTIGTETTFSFKNAFVLNNDKWLLKDFKYTLIERIEID